MKERKTREEIFQAAYKRGMIAIAYREQGMTYKEIGKLLDVSAHRASTIILSAKQRLKMLEKKEASKRLLDSLQRGEVFK